MNINQVNSYVETITNNYLSQGGNVVDLTLHFELMRDRLDEILKSIANYTTLVELRDKPYMTPMLYGYLKEVFKSFLLSSNDIRRDLDKFERTPFDNQSDAEKFNIYIRDILAYMDERSTDNYSAIEHVKSWFGYTKTNYLAGYVEIVTPTKHSDTQHNTAIAETQ